MTNLLGMIEIQLNSETILGGDGVQKETVDMDIQTDKHGFPYFFGKTLKGVLRREAEWYVSHLSGKKKDKFKQALRKLFGKRDDDNNHEHYANYSSLKFGEAKVSDQLLRCVTENNLSDRDVLHSMTLVRSMTRIDRETGTAEEGSLRHARVIKSGYTLFAPIFSPEPLNDTEKDLLEVSVKLLRHIGMMRSRGKGAVTCTLHWNENFQCKTDKKMRAKVKADHATYISVRIDAQEPLKINDVYRTSDSTQALDYIPGHVLRGALVHAYLKDSGLSSEDLNTETIFDDDKIQFWNGYLQIDGNRSMPFPDHLYEEKALSRSSQNIKSVYNALDKKRFKCIEKKKPMKRMSYDMFTISENKLLVQNVKKISSLHLALNHQNRETDKKLYRYESIAPNQSFEAIIKVDTDHDFARWLFEQDERTIWLGGARNSGYGRSLLKFSFLDNKKTEQVVVPAQKRTKQFYILATSDWILQNEHGQIVHALDEQILSDLLGEKVTLEEHIVNSTVTGGYIAPWRAYRPMIQAVQAGSIFKYSVDKEVELQPLKDLGNKGVGMRRNEGFGRFIILPSWPYETLIEYDPVRKNVESITREHMDHTQAQKEKQQFIQDFINHELSKKLQQRVHRWYASIKDHFSTLRERNQSWESLTTTQIGNLLEHTTHIEHNIKRHQQRQNIYVKEWQKFWKAYEKRRKEKATLIYEYIKINNQELKDFINYDLAKMTWETSYFKDEQSEVEDIEWSIQALRLLLQKLLRDSDSPIKSKQKEEGA